MLDRLPSHPRERETAIVNLDSSSGSGTHWVCFHKNGVLVEYFDSYGNMNTAKQLTCYLAGNYVSYNTSSYQSVHSNSEICGHLCLAFLLFSCEN